jgi:hypothetical protein
MESEPEISQPQHRRSRRQGTGHFRGCAAVGNVPGLEAGVAGLVCALAAAGMFPAASCRGHPEPNS